MAKLSFGTVSDRTGMLIFRARLGEPPDQANGRYTRAGDGKHGAWPTLGLTIHLYISRTHSYTIYHSISRIPDSTSNAASESLTLPPVSLPELPVAPLRIYANTWCFNRIHARFSSIIASTSNVTHKISTSNSIGG